MSLRFWAAAGVVAAVAVADLYIGVRSGPSPVGAAELQDGRRALQARLQRGDVAVHSPLFGVEEVRHLGGIRARPDLPAAAVRKTRRVVLLDRRDIPMGGWDEPYDRLIVGPNLYVATFEPTESAEVSVFDLTLDLGPDTMRIERPRGQTVSTCRDPRPQGGFQCGGQPEWVYAASRTLRIGGEDRACVWSHPVAEAAVVLSIPPLPELPPGRRLMLELQGGLTDEAVRQTPNGAPVVTAVVQGGRTLGKITVPNRVGWRRVERPVEPGSGIELVTTAPRDGRRHYCISARVVERDAPGTSP